MWCNQYPFEYNAGTDYSRNFGFYVDVDYVYVDLRMKVLKKSCKIFA